MSGTRADWPGLTRTLEMLREGDTLVVWKRDQLKSHWSTWLALCTSTLSSAETLPTASTPARCPVGSASMSSRTWLE
ncbi:hypothetical protein AF72_08015 [Xylella taiwanensis]|uniref:Resolvase/invertase-type recombinase catalytic domain-containing protein n=1 Tax=Xylella taiwanensis TaxID=1444770 RepID=Z9JJD4_9GAMM|nr:hypothetical protein AF72_08015 [Xylella taiwanensis]